MGWPVAWLKRMITADEFEMWCRYYRNRPFDDQSNHHYPIASLQQTVAAAMGSDKKMTDFLIFREPEKEPDIEDLLLHGDW